MLRGWMASACVLLVQCAPPTSPVEPRPEKRAVAREPTPAERLREGLKLFDASQYSAAQVELSKAQHGASNGLAELGLAQVTLATGRYEQAVAFAEAAVRNDPALASRAATLSARALRAGGKVEQAMARLAAFQSDGEAHEARLLLAELYLEIGQRAQAEPILHGLIEDYNADRITDQDARGLTLAARAAWLLRSPRDANTLFNEAERAHADDPQLLLWRAQLFLEKYDPGHAEEVLNELLRRAPDHPEALTSLAQVRLDQALDFDEAERLARQALNVNPKLSSAYFVLAGIRLRDMELEAADRFIDQGLSTNSRDLPLLALKATVRFLADDAAGFERAEQTVLAKNPEYAELYAILGTYADWEHRYDEVIELMDEALRIDPRDAGALAQLGLNLIRAGKEAPGVQALSRAFALDPYNVRVFNTLNLFDEQIPKSYVSVRHPRFLIRYPKEDRELLDRYLPGLLDRAYQAFKEAYGFEPELPIGIEIYADRQSFAVRTSGLPKSALQGVCFGKTIASLSPRSEPFNLGMTLWHELSHVFHIQLSKSRVPRWFTEGLAEYETLSARAEWTREHDPELYEMVRSERLPSLARMSRAFTRAEELSDVATAYYASSQIVQMLAEQVGRTPLAEMLRAWGLGRQTPEVFREVLGVELPQIDQRFKVALESHLERYPGQFVPIHRARTPEALEPLLRDKPADPELQVELALSHWQREKRQVSAALADRILKQRPKDAQARFLRARLHAQAGELRLAEQLLRSMIRDDQDGYAVDMEIAGLARARGDTFSARAALELAHRKDPTQVKPLLALAEIARSESALDEEVELLKKITRLSEHSPAVHRRLLERLVQEKRYTEAVVAGEAALWVDLHGMHTHRWFAEALAGTGDLKRARFELESALLCPGSAAEQAELHARLAELLLKTNDKGAARKHAAEARALDPKSPQVQGPGL